MSIHELVIVADPDDDPRIELRCHAAPDAPCRRRPPDWETRDDRSCWTDEEATEPGHPCWAVEWLDATGLDALCYDGPQIIDLPGVPIDISYDECVTWSVADTPTDQEIEAAAQALHADECAEDPDPGEPCTCDSAYYERMARIALNAAKESRI